jgi:uncharacterized protein YdbL (DUF1318 family)
MHGSVRALALVAVILISGLMVAGPASATTLDEYKAAGQVGERPDGYIGVVSGGADVSQFVVSINAKRRDKYQEIATNRDTTVEAVEVIAGAKLIERSASGHYIMTSAGNWVRK